MTTVPVPEQNGWNFRRIVRVTLLVVVVALGFWLVYRFNHILFLLFTAITLGTVLRPLVAWLVRRGIPRPIAVTLVYVVLFAGIVGFVTLLIPLFSEQGGRIVDSLPAYYRLIHQVMLNSRIGMLVNLANRLPSELAGATPLRPTGEQVLAGAGRALAYANSVAWMAFYTIMVLLLAFQWTLIGPRTIQALLLLLPLDNRERTADLIAAMESKVSSFVAGQGILCLVIAVMALIAYLIIGLPSPLALALIAGLMEAVPMVGPLLGAFPAGIVALAVSPEKLLLVVISTVIIQQLENNLLVPRVMNRAVGINPFVALLAIFGFTSFFGIAGALMAIPIAAMVQILLDRFVFEQAPPEMEAPEGRDYASRLRYEAQDLAQGLRSQARVTKDAGTVPSERIDELLDEMEALASDIDASLAQIRSPGGQ